MEIKFHHVDHVVNLLFQELLVRLVKLEQLDHKVPQDKLVTLEQQV